MGAVAPVFENGHRNDLVFGDEGKIIIAVYDALDRIALAAGRTPLSAFDKYADVPEEVLRHRWMTSSDPDFSDFAAAWHEPAHAVATLDVLCAAVSAGPWTGRLGRDDVLDSLHRLRVVLYEGVQYQTRFHFVVA